MARLKLTSQELKRKKAELKRFERYLPMLILKKLQLQNEVGRVREALNEKHDEERALRSEMAEWAAVMGEDVGLGDLTVPEDLVTGKGNIAGVQVPVFEELVFADISYDFYATPLWVDRAVEALERLSVVGAEARILKEQLFLLERELRITSQRVNLFEKIMIPRTRAQIRTIQVYLGDQQAASVVRGKVAKKKAAERVGGGALGS